MEKINYKNTKIILVDDDQDILVGYEKALKRIGMQVEVFNNPKVALEYLKENKVEVILLDYFMPQLNGDQFLEELKAIENNSIVILQTGYADKLPPQEMIDELNIQGYFDKEKGFEELILQVKSAIKTSALLKEVNQLSYKKEFISNLLIGVTDETKDQVMAISGQRIIIDDKANEYSDKKLKEASDSIKDHLEKISKRFQALNFETEDNKLCNLSKVFDTVKILTFVKSSFEFNLEDNVNITVKCKGSSLIYILSEIVTYLYNNNIEQTEIVARKTEQGVNILIKKQYDYDSEIIEKIKTISASEKSIQIEINNDNMLEISVND